ncbi:MAG: hypothetical protein KIT31_00680 [Deltaproteobacteria bacterium]|nr:hypothetical protein [Deltaproteobacteria bacterium]
MIREPLRVGVALDDARSRRAPAWVARAIEYIQASAEARIVAILDRGPPPQPSVARRAYDALDRRLFRIANDPLAAVAVDDRLAGVPIDLPERARDHRLDVIIDFGAPPIAAAAARHGVWSYSFGDPLRDILTRTPVTGSFVHDAEGNALYESWARTDPVSLRRNRTSSHWKASTFAARLLRDLHRRGADASAPRPHRVDRPAVAAAAGLRTFGRELLRDRARRLVGRDPWVLAYRIDADRGPVPSASEDTELTLLVPPLDRFWADPFVTPAPDGWFLFLEERCYDEPHAHISVMHVDRAGRIGPPSRALATPYHLSYPFVFAWSGSWWMIPETSRNRTVELWRATEFPHRWVRERVLLEDVIAVDATLIEHGGRWWMFCNVGERGASKDDELHLFHATTPLGPWIPHSTNPTKSDVRSARPAGRPWQVDGVWYRPAQDGSGGYGSRIVIHRIDRLDEQAFAETATGTLVADERFVGLHTINACDGLTVVDVRAWRPRYRLLERLDQLRSAGASSSPRPVKIVRTRASHV